MTKSYQSMMTLGPAFSVSIHEQPDTMSFQSELPEPAGAGWILKQVIPVHNNPKYLQYFWQRELVEDENKGSSESQIKVKTGAINLGI